MYNDKVRGSPTRRYVMCVLHEDHYEVHYFTLPEVTQYNEILENTCNQATWYYYHWIDDEIEELYGAIPYEDYINLKNV